MWAITSKSTDMDPRVFDDMAELLLTILEDAPDENIIEFYSFSNIDEGEIDLPLSGYFETGEVELAVARYADAHLSPQVRPYHVQHLLMSLAEKGKDFVADFIADEGYFDFLDYRIVEVQ